MTQISQITGSV